VIDATQVKLLTASLATLRPLKRKALTDVELLSQAEPRRLCTRVCFATWIAYGRPIGQANYTLQLWYRYLSFLWSPYGIGQTIIFSSC